MTAATIDAGRELLAARLAAIPAALQQTLDESEARPDLGFARGLAAAERERPVFTTGIGASEGPARVLADLLGRAGRRAGFRPLSQLVAEAGSPGTKSACGDALLVLFSQGLSPNAELALALAPRFRGLLVYTSVRPDAGGDRAAAALARAARDGALIAVLPPACEDRLFLRVLGPATATLAALQLAEAWCGGEPGWPLRRLPAAASAALAEGQARCAAFAAEHGLGALLAERPDLPIALLSTAGYGELCHSLRWQLLEGAGLREPAVWDALGFAHGPLQQVYRNNSLLLALRHPGEQVAELWPRLRRVLRPEQRYLELPASLPAPLALVEHQLQIGALVLEALRAVDWSLERWPGQGCDGALYELREPAELLGRAAAPPAD